METVVCHSPSDQRGICRRRWHCGTQSHGCSHTLTCSCRRRSQTDSFRCSRALSIRRNSYTHQTAGDNLNGPRRRGSGGEIERETQRQGERDRESYILRNISDLAVVGSDSGLSSHWLSICLLVSTGRRWDKLGVSFLLGSPNDFHGHRPGPARESEH